MKIDYKYNIDIAEQAPISQDVINNIDGVVAADYKNGSVTITIDDNREDDAAEILQEVVTAIRQSGGKVITESIVRPVLNMTCAACASSSQNILSYVPGVISASVNYGNGKGAIEYLPNIVSPEKMKNSLQEIGYEIGRAHV